MDKAVYISAGWGFVGFLVARPRPTKWVRINFKDFSFLFNGVWFSKHLCANSTIKLLSRLTNLEVMYQFQIRKQFVLSPF